MIKIHQKTPKTKKKTPYYLLDFDYMIGDADGQTSKKAKVSIDNPFVERFVTLLNGLKPLKGTWGIVFEEYDFHKFLKEGQLSREDFDFLTALMFEYYDGEETSTFKVDEKDKEYSNEFYEAIQGETEYSFLVFEGITLSYVDEYGEKHKTYFEA